MRLLTAREARALPVQYRDGFGPRRRATDLEAYVAYWERVTFEQYAEEHFRPKGYSVLKDAWVEQTRVPHECAECFEEIPVNETCHRLTYSWEGALRTEYRCARCKRLGFV